MNDYLRESLSYFGLYRRMFQVKKRYKPVMVSYGQNREQYFLYYEPERVISDKVIVWVHGGGWNAGNPKLFDFVGQCVCGQGYRFVSLGYRLSPKYKYPCQIKDVCEGYNSAIRYLQENGIDVSKVVVAGPSAGAHLTSIMCYCRKVQRKLNVDVSNIVGFIGFGGPYSFRDDQSLTLKLLLDQLFKKNYNRKNGEPVALMGKSRIPMLLIQTLASCTVLWIGRIRIHGIQRACFWRPGRRTEGSISFSPGLRNFKPGEGQTTPEVV